MNTRATQFRYTVKGDPFKIGGGLLSTAIEIQNSRFYRVTRDDGQLVGYYSSHGSSGWSAKITSDDGFNPSYSNSDALCLFVYGTWDTNFKSKEDAIAMFLVAVNGGEAVERRIRVSRIRAKAIAEWKSFVIGARRSIGNLCGEGEPYRGAAILKVLAGYEPEQAAPAIDLLGTIDGKLLGAQLDIVRLESIHAADVADFFATTKAP